MSKDFLKDIKSKQAPENKSDPKNQTEPQDKQNKTFKSTQGEILYRIAQIQNLLLQGKSYQDIYLIAENQNWNKSKETVRDYIAKAQENINAFAENQNAFTAEWHMQQRLELYAIALKNLKISDALKVLDSLRDTQGLTPKPGAALDMTIAKIVDFFAESAGIEISVEDIRHSLAGSKAAPLTEAIDASFEEIPEK